MKIIINSKNLVPNENWQFFRKVRAIIENKDGKIAICSEGGKVLFPGGKCEKKEDEIIAIKREVFEETGIDFDLKDFQKVLEIETLYDDFYNYRFNAIKPRHTITTYYYVKTDKEMNKQKMKLTDKELQDNFKSLFVDKNTLLNMLLEDHSKFENGKFFDEENQIIAKKIIEYK